MIIINLKFKMCTDNNLTYSSPVSPIASLTHNRIGWVVRCSVIIRLLCAQLSIQTPSEKAKMMIKRKKSKTIRARWRAAKKNRTPNFASKTNLLKFEDLSCLICISFLTIHRSLSSLSLSSLVQFGRRHVFYTIENTKHCEEYGIYRIHLP